MFSPRLRPPKGHERLYGSCKMNVNLFCTELNGECKYFILNGELKC